MSLGIVIVAVWFVFVSSYLVWQFAVNALESPESASQKPVIVGGWRPARGGIGRRERTAAAVRSARRPGRAVGLVRAGMAAGASVQGWRGAAAG